MNSFQYNKLSSYFSRFQTKPEARILVRFIEEESYPVTFEIIETNIVNHLYITLFDFALDIRGLILSAQKYYSKNPNAMKVLEDLSYQFEEKLGKFPRSESEEANYKLEKSLKKFSLIRRAMSMSAYTPQNQKLPTPKVSIPKTAHGPPAPQIQEIQRLINEITDVGVLAEVARILKKHIPDFQIQENTTIDAKLISMKCIEELRFVLANKNK